MLCNKAPNSFDRIGIVGHVGVGHSHSADGLVQDDSAGFAVVSELMRRCIPVDLTISSVRCDPSTRSFTVELKGGGRGRAVARCGITPVEGELAQRVLGMDGSLCHKATYHAFGRCYGQGVSEVPTALEGAIALAVVDTFRRCAADHVHYADCATDFLADCVLGFQTTLHQIPVSLMLVVNMTCGGIGPAEDLEGNTDLGPKGQLISRLQLDHIPNIIVESKADSPVLSSGLDHLQHLIRFREVGYEPAVAAALKAAADALGIPAETSRQQIANQYLKKRTCSMADKLISLGEQLKQAETAQEKVLLSAALAEFVRKDMGSISFMSNSLYDKVGGCGVLPGSGAVLSLLMPSSQTAHGEFPIVEPSDVLRYCQIILGALPLLWDERSQQ